MLPKYQKVLVTTDLSPLGNAAVPHAYAIVAEQGGTVILWCAVDVSGMPDPLYSQPTPGETLAEERAEIREDLFSSLEALVPEEVRVEGKVKTEVRVLEISGSVHDAICEEAKAKEVDLIVMASHGYSGMKHLLIGSVVEHVLRTVDRPVLVVRGGK
ncbi:UspA protein [Candidatus Methylomirabilis lanthanidiphila]|uniref:UspA protein n=1 Tax=Candidatus Methylomirabilis lanthanidiphila TaxID=2211376 RepID=A0A564ZPC4_9BACT|nr:universal stress protein [Candidatus Methylomirabilis lanthanidiphila]VUZ86408.1 UspA protein [Candidatus Methylomirabilis lanthanidiphila]